MPLLDEIAFRDRVGQALIELTRPRAPCATLDVYGTMLGKELWDAQVKAGDPASQRWGMGGFYAAVVESGVVRPDDIIALVDQAV